MRLPLILALVLLAVPAWGATAPRVSVTSAAQLPTPLPLPFDEKGDAAKDVVAAFARAGKSGKRVLIDFGGNWCPDCRVLSGVMALPEIKAFIAAHYEVVTVDVGRFDKNLDLVRRYGIPKLKGVPTVVIAEKDGRLLNPGNAAELSNASTMTPQSVADWLARWAI